MRYVLALFAATVACAQPISIGVKGGLPLNDAFSTGSRSGLGSYFSDTKRYTVGPQVDIGLPGRLAIEFNALYKRYSYGGEFSVPAGVVSSSTRANSWEFPLLLKWRVLPGPIRPFVSGGVTFHHLYGFREVRSFFSGSNLRTEESDGPSALVERNNYGGVLAGGVELRTGFLRFAPEFRYTRWSSESFRDTARGLLRFSRNQGEFLLGVTFP